MRLKGKVHLKFTIEKDEVFDFSILRDIGYGSGEEALGFKIIAKLDQPWLTTNPYGWNIVYLLALKQNNNLVKQKIRFYERRIHLLQSLKRAN
jgi:hypothetical protein